MGGMTANRAIKAPQKEGGQEGERGTHPIRLMVCPNTQFRH